MVDRHLSEVGRGSLTKQLFVTALGGWLCLLQEPHCLSPLLCLHFAALSKQFWDSFVNSGIILGEVLDVWLNSFNTLFLLSLEIWDEVFPRNRITLEMAEDAASWVKVQT